MKKNIIRIIGIVVGFALGSGVSFLAGRTGVT